MNEISWHARQNHQNHKNEPRETQYYHTQKQPKISFYYSSVSLAAGSLLFRDLKTISTLGGAAAGMAKLSALGKTNDEIMTFLQPIAVDLHMIGNPYANYNYYLSSVMVPGLYVHYCSLNLINLFSLSTE